MSRLTQRDGDSYTYSEYATSIDGSCCFGFARLKNEAIDKLGEHEDKLLIYVNGSKAELGIVKRVCGGDDYFINYNTGDTAARTHASHLMKVSNRYVFHIVRLDPDGNERKKIVGTTTVNKALERFLLDQCPEVKKKLKALEIIKEKTVDLGSLLYYAKNHNHALAFYNMGMANENKKLTKDEFHSLKEALR